MNPQDLNHWRNWLAQTDPQEWANFAERHAAELAAVQTAWARYQTETGSLKADGQPESRAADPAPTPSDDTGSLNFDTASLLYTTAAASCLGLGYAVWNIGISRGNMTVLAGASYFIPIFSACISSFLLQTPLPVEFWQGAAMVCLGSSVCWLATRTVERKRY